VPFIRHTRDKRGNETTYVMHAYRPAQGPQKTRVLYLFRSPSHLKMGRHALDEEIREALEHTHPDVSFDWSALGRESAVVREERQRPRGPRAVQPPGPRPSAPVPIEVVLDDQSVLGRAAGAERAAQLRAQYGDLLQRITRRSRTPEDRDRLTERAQRLNPDDWPDEAEVAAHLESIQAEWDAVAAELPSRRRGRRGGRRRDHPEGGADDGSTSAAPDLAEAPSSGIMADGGDLENDSEGPYVARADRAPDVDRDDSGLGAEGASEPAGDGFPDDD
jgi:hypothetical protein